jgi:hypothetical protein
MRKLSLLLLITVISILSCRRENNSMDDFFKAYEGLEGVSIAKLPPALFLPLLKRSGYVQDSSVENIDLIRIMVYNKTDDNNPDWNLIRSEIITRLDGLQFEDLINYSGGGDEGVIRILDTGEYISDLVVLINNSKSLSLIGISGKMQMSDITKLATGIDFKSFRDFKIN